jgi:Ran GTPase-activating protein (RanGAP) involved in mRNA processing and transport
LSHNRFLSADALLRLFTQGGCDRLTSLDVSQCGVWVSSRNEGAYQTPLAHCMSLCTNLTALRLAGNRLGDFFGHLLCTTVLPACTSLTLLDLADTRLSEHGVRALAPTFKTCPHLVLLNLEDNMIEDDRKAVIRRQWDAVHVPEGLVV